MKKILLTSLCAFVLFMEIAPVYGQVKMNNVPVLNLNDKFKEKRVDLQLIGNVRYICFDASEDALLGDKDKLVPIGDKFFFYNGEGGSITGFDETGKLICNFNHRGQGANEYNQVKGVAYDERAKEVYVLSKKAFSEFFVFDLNGNFRRKLEPEKAVEYAAVISFDDASLLAFDNTNSFVIRNGKPMPMKPQDELPDKQPYVLIDKKNGKIISRLQLSFSEILKPYVLTKHNGLPWVFIGDYTYFVNQKDGIVLNTPLSDTMYKLKSDKTIQPIFSTTPNHVDMEHKIMTGVLADAPGGMLVKSILLHFKEGGPEGLPEKLYLYNPSDKSFTACKFNISDYHGSDDIFSKPYVSDNKLFFILQPFMLLRALDNNQLSGELKKIAAKLNEEDNFIVMEVSMN